jgi:hypothetical protein
VSDAWSLANPASITSPLTFSSYLNWSHCSDAADLLIEESGKRSKRLRQYSAALELASAGKKVCLTVTAFVTHTQVYRVYRQRRVTTTQTERCAGPVICRDALRSAAG